MGRLKRALEQRAAATGQPRSLYMPRVTQPVHITHKTSYTAKVGRTQTFAPPLQQAWPTRNGTISSLPLSKNPSIGDLLFHMLDGDLKNHSPYI